MQNQNYHCEILNTTDFNMTVALVCIPFLYSPELLPFEREEWRHWHLGMGMHWEHGGSCFVKFHKPQSMVLFWFLVFLNCFEVHETADSAL